MKPKFINTQEGSTISFQAQCPTVNDITQKMEFLVLIEQEDKEDVVVTFARAEAKILLKELKHIVNLLDVFG